MLTISSVPIAERAASILNAVHTLSTQYAVVCDLTTDLAYVCHVRDFRQLFVIDLAPLWAEGSERIALSSLR